MLLKEQANGVLSFRGQALGQVTQLASLAGVRVDCTWRAQGCLDLTLTILVSRSP